MKTSTLTMWAVVDGDGDIQRHSIRDAEYLSKLAFREYCCGISWAEALRQGYRVAKVTVELEG